MECVDAHLALSMPIDEAPIDAQIAGVSAKSELRETEDICRAGMPEGEQVPCRIALTADQLLTDFALYKGTHDAATEFAEKVQESTSSSTGRYDLHTHVYQCMHMKHVCRSNSTSKVNHDEEVHSLAKVDSEAAQVCLCVYMARTHAEHVHT